MLVALLTMTAAVYSRCLFNGFVYDDFPVLVYNRRIAHWSYFWNSFIHDCWWFRNPGHLPQSAYYRPLQGSLFALGYHLFGLAPLKWHLLKIGMHLTVVVLSFRFAQLLSGRVAVGLVTALLFGLLPVGTESVVWATAVGEPLAAIFEIGALLFFIQRERTARWRGYVIPALLFAAALLSHESAIVFPAMIAVYVLLTGADAHADLAPGAPQDHPLIGDGPKATLATRLVAAIKCTIPFLLVCALYLGARAFALGPQLGFGLHGVRWSVNLANGRMVIQSAAVDSIARDHILATIPLVLVNYLKILTVPWLGGPAHRVEVVKAIGVGNFYLPLALLAVIAVALHLASRTGARRRLRLFCVAWFGIALAPAFNLDKIIALVQDRYLYLPALGFCLLVADCAIGFGMRSAARAGIAGLAVAMFAVSCAAAVWMAEPFWHDNVTLFSECVRRFPDSVLYRTDLAEALSRKGDLEGASRQLACAVQLDPKNYRLHDDLGQIYLKLGRKQAAEREFREYLALFAPWSVHGAAASDIRYRAATAQH